MKLIETTRNFITINNILLIYKKLYKVMDSVLLWGSLTESCLRAVTFYTRAYQEILNTLYKSIINKK